MASSDQDAKKDEHNNGCRDGNHESYYCRCAEYCPEHSAKFDDCIERSRCWDCRKVLIGEPFRIKDDRGIYHGYFCNTECILRYCKNNHNILSI